MRTIPQNEGPAQDLERVQFEPGPVACIPCADGYHEHCDGRAGPDDGDQPCACFESGCP